MLTSLSVWLGIGANVNAQIKSSHAPLAPARIHLLLPERYFDSALMASLPSASCIERALNKQAVYRQIPLAGIVTEGKDTTTGGHIGQLFGNGRQRRTR